MVSPRKRPVKDTESETKIGGEENEPSTSKSSRRSVNQKSPSSVHTPGPISAADSTDNSPRASKDHSFTPSPKAETPTKCTSKRSSHLLVSPVPQAQTPTRRSRRPPIDLSKKSPQLQTPTKCSGRRPIDLGLNIKGSEDLPQMQTPTRRSRRLSTDLGLSEGPLQVQTPTRRSRRLSTDLSEDPPQVQTPTRRSRRLSTDLSEDPPQVQTPTRRSRRNSTESADTPTVKPLSGVQVLARRSRRVSTDLTDASTSQALTPTKRSRRLSIDLSDAPPEVQTPTRRSRRLSSDDRDDDELEVHVLELLEVVSKTKAAAKTCKRTLATLADNLSTVTPSRRSRRQSGSGLTESANEKPLCVLEEEDEDKDDDKMDTGMSKSKTDVLEVIEEDEKENELELKISDDDTDKTDTGMSKSKTDVLEVIEEDEKENEPELKISNADIGLNSTEKNLETRPVEEEEKSGDNLKILAEKQPIRLPEMQKEMTKYNVNKKSEVIAVTISSSPKGASSINEKSQKLRSPSEERVDSTTASVNDKKDPVSSTTSAIIEKVKENEENKSAAATITNQVTGDVNQIIQSNNNLGESKFTNVRGMPASGRWWKEEKKRFNSINKDMGPKSSWTEKMKRKQALKDVLSLKVSIQEDKKRKKADLRERQRLNTIRRDENAKKSEIVQVIKDSRKIKKMKKSQLRYIETRDTSQLKSKIQGR